MKERGCILWLTVAVGVICAVSSARMLVIDSQLRQSERARHELMDKFQPTIWPDTGVWIGTRHVKESEVPDLASWLKKNRSKF